MISVKCSTALAGAAMLAGSVVSAGSGLPTSVLAPVAGIALLSGLAYRPLRALCWLAAGVALTALIVSRELELRWPMARDQQRVLVEMRIVSLLGEQGGAWTGDGEIRILRPDGEPDFRRRARFSWPMRGAAPRAGETWQLLMRLAPPRARLNPGGVDMERQWLRERVHAQGRVLESSLNLRLHAAPHGLLALRESIAAQIRGHALDREAGALFAALAVGATAHMTREQWRVFNATGTTHLVAISGLHVTLFAWLAAHAARRAWRGFVWLRVPGFAGTRRETFALTTGLVAAFGYSLLAGFSIPAQRTLFMLAAYVAARSSARSVAAPDLLGAACIGVLLLDPLAPLAAGFWLSFGAMAALLGAPAGPAASAGRAAPGPLAKLEVMRRRVASIRSAVVAQAWLAVALVPLTLVVFGGVSLAGWLANFAAIPLFSFVLVPLALLGAVTCALWPALAAPCLALAERVHDLAWPALSAVANMPLALWQGSATPAWYAASAVALLVLRLPGPWLWRATTLLVALPLAAGRGSGVASNDVQLSILDAGSGVAVLVRTARHALVYDTGEIWGSEGGAVTRDLAPLLRSHGIGQLDMLVLSRADAFQVVGAAQLLSSFQTGVGYTGGTWRSAPAPIEPCPWQRRWRWDGVEFELLAAPPLVSAGDLAARAGSSARGSCVLRVDVGGKSVLIATSLTEHETRVWQARGGTRSAAVLVAPQRRVAADWRRDVAADWIVASRRRTTDAQRARLGAWYGLAPAAVLATDRTGPLRLDLSANGAMRWSSMLDPVRVPLWRVPREALPD